MENRRLLDTLAAAWAEILGISPPEHAAEANPELVDFAKKAFDGKTADRIFYITRTPSVSGWTKSTRSIFLRLRAVPV